MGRVIIARHGAQQKIDKSEPGTVSPILGGMSRGIGRRPDFLTVIVSNLLI
jgi:hypothetical protein